MRLVVRAVAGLAILVSAGSLVTPAQSQAPQQRLGAPVITPVAVAPAGRTAQ